MEATHCRRRLTEAPSHLCCHCLTILLYIILPLSYQDANCKLKTLARNLQGRNFYGGSLQGTVGDSIKTSNKSSLYGGPVCSPSVLLNHTKKMRTLSSLELPRAVAVATGQSSPISDGGPPSYENQERTEVGTFDRSASLIKHNGRQRQKFQDPARDISIQLLEKFSLVTLKNW